MILKNKNKIILVLTIILFINTTFLPPKKTQAFDFVITPTVLWALGSLVTASGIIALNHEQVVDMGQYVWDRLEYKEGNMVYDVVNGVKSLIGVKADKNTIDAVSSVAHSIKSGEIENKYKDEVSSINVEYPSVVLGYDNSFIIPSDTKILSYNGSSSVSYMSDSFNKYASIRFVFEPIRTNATSINSSVLDPTTYGITNSNSWQSINHIYSSTSFIRDINIGFGVISDYTDGGKLKLFCVTSGASSGTFKIIGDYVEDMTIKLNSKVIDKIKHSDVKSIIDYSSSYSGYVEGLVVNELPYTDEVPGVITIPQSIPVDLPLTTEFPLTWDRAKEIVIPGVIPKETDVPGVGEIDIPGVGEIDIPGVGEIDIPKFNTDGTAAIDLSPLYIDLKGKFPFCVPFDLINMITMFKSNRVTPHFTVKFDEGLVGGGEFEIDFSKFDKLASILRFFILFYFTFFLIKTSKSFATNG